MKKALQTAVLAGLGVLFLFLCGCGSTSGTRMEVSDGFAGRRVISCDLQKKELSGSIAGGEEALDAFLKDNCPQPLTWEKSDEGSRVVYRFSLSFANLEDYRGKVRALLGREPRVAFTQPETPLTSGIRLREDFSSDDLLAWFYTGAVEKGLLEPGTRLWRPEGDVVLYGGRSLETDSPLQVNQVTYLNVDKICIETALQDDGFFERKITFWLPQATLEQGGEALTAYLEGLVPDKGDGIWRETDWGKDFQISFHAQGVSELEQLTNQALDSSLGTAAAVSQNETLFSRNHQFEESLDFSAFSSGSTGKVYVEYAFTLQDGAGFTYAEEWEAGKWRSAGGGLEQGRFYTEGDRDFLRVKLESQNEYTLSQIAVELHEQPDRIFQRGVTLTFSGASAPFGAQKAGTYFDSLNVRGLSVYVEDIRCVLTISGTAEEVSQSLTQLFGEGNNLLIKTEDGFQPRHSFTVVDQIDLTRFASSAGYSGSDIAYRFVGQEALTAFYRQEGDTSAQSLGAEGPEAQAALPLFATVNMTRSTYYWPYLLLAGLGLLVSAGALIFLIWLFPHLRKRRASVKGKFVLSGQLCPLCGAPLYQGMSFCVRCGGPATQEGRR
jgi:hypothetical protein